MPPARMTGDSYRQGLLDTNILILRRWIDPAEIPAEVAITAVTNLPPACQRDAAPIPPWTRPAWQWIVPALVDTRVNTQPGSAIGAGCPQL